MMDLPEFKKFLGPELAGTYTDEELVRLEWEMRTLAEILLDYHVYRKQRESKRRKQQSTTGLDTDQTTI